MTYLIDNPVAPPTYAPKRMSQAFAANDRSPIAQFWRAHDYNAGINNHFFEIQRGPNPLTNADIERLIARRPEVWARFKNMGVTGT